MSETLGVLESTAPVVEQAEHVQINNDRIKELCLQWKTSLPSVSGWNDRVHWSDGSPSTANFVLLLDALNFCFWPDPGQPKWKVSYEGVLHDGYMALAASLKRAIEAGDRLYEAERMASVTKSELEEIFRGEQRIPMLADRVDNVREAGRVLLERYDGSFAQAIESAQGSAVKLTRILVDHFPSFKDEALYKGAVVKFYKRAQITVTDLIGSFGGEGLGFFPDAHRLTAFADYKIPQVLEALGVLVYSEELARTLERYELIAAEDPREVEIRAGMVWAIERISQQMRELGREILPYELDWFLWRLGQSPSLGEKPYHRTRTIYY